MMAHICMVLISDIRYDGRVRKEIETLHAAGHQVELIVTAYQKTGRGGEDLNCKIHYLPMRLWSKPSVNFVEQLLFNFKAMRLLKTIKPTHIHCHDLETLLAAIWANRQVKAKVILDAHELLPESLRGVKEKIWNVIEKWSIAKCDDIIMPEPNRITYFQTKYPQVKPLLFLGNYPRQRDLPDKVQDLFRQLYPIDREQKIVLYTGRIGAERHNEELVESIALSSDRFVLVLLGMTYRNYDEVLRKKIQQLGVENRVFIHDAVPHKEILGYMASCDIGVAFYHNTDLNNYYCAPNKLYEYIALNKVVLTNNYPGLLDTVSRYRQGICLADVTPKSLADAYERVCDPELTTPGNHKYYWDDQQDILLGVYAVTPEESGMREHCD